jgi:O-antigen/teichoic acid export membrane protein
MGNSQRIAKNTLLLSVRMVLIMLVSLYTVRVVLNTLGVVDYGIYNVVGGAVLFFSFLSNTMSHATQRFFSYELGKKEGGNLKEMFHINFTVYLLIILVVVILSATVGVWFLMTKMVIPENRMDAAYWIYVCTLVSFVIRMLTAPYQAVLIAHEKMALFAWLSVAEVCLLLVIVFYRYFLLIN